MMRHLITPLACAGLVLGRSELSHRAAAEALPLQNAFAVLFFVAVGMLFDPTVLVRDPVKVAAVLGIILFAKSLAAFVILLLLRYPIATAVTVSAALAQIGLMRRPKNGYSRPAATGTLRAL